MRVFGWPVTTVIDYVMWCKIFYIIFKIDCIWVDAGNLSHVESRQLKRTVQLYTGAEWCLLIESGRVWYIIRTLHLWRYDYWNLKQNNIWWTKVGCLIVDIITLYPIIMLLINFSFCENIQLITLMREVYKV
jgi:hypothetical protein